MTFLIQYSSAPLSSMVLIKYSSGPPSITDMRADFLLILFTYNIDDLSGHVNLFYDISGNLVRSRFLSGSNRRILIHVGRQLHGGAQLSIHLHGDFNHGFHGFRLIPDRPGGLVQPSAITLHFPELLCDVRSYRIQQGEEGEFQDIIPDRHAMTPDQILGDVESVFRLMDLLEKLEERERRILEMRFGLRGNRPLTLEEVSQEIGRTRERVRQIQNQALSKLKQLLVDEAGFAAD